MSKAVYSCFTFRRTGEVPNAEEFHRTHKYFGEQDENKIAEIKKEIDVYFAHVTANIHPRWEFNSIAQFNDDCVVLLLTQPSIVVHRFKYLRAALDQFYIDDFSPYHPHVTVKNERGWKPKGALRMPAYFEPEFYVLMRGQEVLERWRLFP